MFQYLKLLAKRERKTWQDSFELIFNVNAIAEQKIDRFRNLFNIARGEELPISYAFIASFKPLMKVLSDKKFAFSPLGLIHISANFSLNSKLDYSQPFAIRFKVDQSGIHPLGHIITVTSHFFQNDKECLINTNTMLKKTKTQKSTRKELPHFDGKCSLLVDKTLARQYAKVSDDYNPIHISSWLAKLFGMQDAIMHGMYLGHLVLINNDVKAKQVEIKFKKPCFLPTQIGILTNSDEATDIDANTEKYKTFQVYSLPDNLHLELVCS
ncbi:MaoC/PaaZ C-terminal domain-containing protein [Thalassotalea crassostreae]|uniref:MaoC/PaaZ C-terminal domain-containing protein n=1 Tax=Thalassotalea crassostreae TaxID=1763536 RepID=UPI00083814AD|nr:MaoC/PaaZ C-terminal domain-containing protein [Thalassotalea crassostreae]